MRHTKAFSLVELSIVLVILGLLTGGILAGQSLIRAAELRNITREHQSFITAVHSFRDKYMAFPGDMTNASSFWGLMTNCGVASPSGSGTQTCNGNGNGRIDDPSAAGRTGEIFTFWQQLANAGAIEGSYTAIAGAAGVDHSILAENIPKSKFPNAGWSTQYLNLGATATRYGMNYGNSFSFGAATSDSSARGGILRVDELWGIDTKIDDGMPGRGRIIAINYNVCTSAADGVDYAAPYLLNSANPNRICAFYVKEAY